MKRPRTFIACQDIRICMHTKRANVPIRRSNTATLAASVEAKPAMVSGRHAPRHCNGQELLSSVNKEHFCCAYLARSPNTLMPGTNFDSHVHIPADIAAYADTTCVAQYNKNYTENQLFFARIRFDCLIAQQLYSDLDCNTQADFRSRIILARPFEISWGYESINLHIAMLSVCK